MNDDKIIDYESLSRIKVDGIDSKIDNQDARKVLVANGENDYKRTSDFMLGNDGKNLEDGVYISVEEFSAALNEAVKKNDKIEKVIMKKTGKKISKKHLDQIVKNAKKAGVITLQKNEKIENQKAKIVSVQTPSMESTAKVAGMMLGKNGMDLANGDYVKQEELEFTVVSKKAVPAPDMKSGQKLAKTIKGLTTVAVGVGMVALLPWIMHANSVAWHHVGPEMQNVLHTINLGLGKLINASYSSNADGLWESFRGVAMNSDAATASLAGMFATYGLTAAGLAKITHDIKNGLIKVSDYIKGKKESKEPEDVELGGIGR